jgi:hypothetical protein
MGYSRIGLSEGPRAPGEDSALGRGQNESVREAATLCLHRPKNIWQVWGAAFINGVRNSCRKWHRYAFRWARAEIGVLEAITIPWYLPRVISFSTPAPSMITRTRRNFTPHMDDFIVVLYLWVRLSPHLN